jgi:hypothetical protein
MLHAGGRRLEDLREFRAEQEVLGVSGLEAVPDPGTVGDWLRRQGAGRADFVLFEVYGFYGRESLNAAGLCPLTAASHK